jgi:hypothetical protein
MNKVGLSLSILSLCWFISTTGWSGGLVSNNSFSSSNSSSKAILDNTPTQDQQSVEEKDQQSGKEMLPLPLPDLQCGETITITDSDGKVTTIKKTCDDEPSSPLCCLESKGNNH